MRAPAVLLLAFALSGCAGTRYTVHPGSVDTFESVAYDTLLEAQTAIDAAKANLAAGKPYPSKDVINRASRAYNVAKDALKLYHDTRGINKAALATDLADVLKLLESIRKVN